MSSDTTIQVAESIRTAFLSGLSATEWVGWSKSLHVDLFSSSTPGGDDVVAGVICDTVLSLLSSFHGNTVLRDYLRISVTDPYIPVQLAQLLAVFLRNARPPNIHDPSTLDMVCRLILTLHYDSNMPPTGSLTPYPILPAQLLSTISDALALLRLSYEFTSSPFHHLPTSASELVILLLSCVSNLSNLAVSSSSSSTTTTTTTTTTQVSILLSQVHEVLQVVQTGSDIRHALDSFLLVLSLLLGDGSSRQADDAEMFASFQLTPKPDGATGGASGGAGAVAGGGGSGDGGTNPNLDLLTGTLIMNRLISDRALPSGSGTEHIAIANLMAWFRVSSPPQSLSIFYAHVLLSVIACLGQTPVELDANRNYLWKSFLLGRIPVLFQKFQDRITLESPEIEHSDTVLQSAVAQVFTHHDLLDQCGEIKVSSGDMMNVDDDVNTRNRGNSLRYELLISLILAKLIDHKFAVEMIPTIPIPMNAQTKFAMHVHESGSDTDSYVDSKFSADVSWDDMQSFVDRVMVDIHSHAPFTTVLHSRFIHACQSHDIERLGRICKVLTEHETLLEVLTLHTRLYDMIAHSLACLNDFDMTTVGDPQTAVTHIGEVVLFLQSTLARYRVRSSIFSVDGRSLSADQIVTCSVIYPPDALSQEEKFVLEAWRKAIFDPNGEGIDDNILRSTKHQSLLSLSATLVCDAVDACISTKPLDPSSSSSSSATSALQNGLSLYMSPLLNWTLVGIVQALLNEVERLSFQSPQHVRVLEAILSHKDCPRSVLRITRQQILRLYSDPKAQVQQGGVVPNMTSLVSNVLKVSPPTSQNIKEQGAWLQEPRNIIRHALASASTITSKLPTTTSTTTATTAPQPPPPPPLDIAKCLSMTNNIRTFFDFTWREMLAAASVGKIEVCRRFAAVLLAPTCGTCMESCAPSVPPLLPLFLHAYVPVLLVGIDDEGHQQSRGGGGVGGGGGSANQTLSVQLLAAVVISALTFAAHFERALVNPPAGGNAAEGGGVKVPQLPCSAMARKLRMDLRKLKGPSALALFQKLSASSTFVATFPTL